ncbi:MAG: hypothetical protein JST96_14575, partial [Bacteroidetes bacterium]|nr:hypothetical protein [Bacteroidota bacterium]
MKKYSSFIITAILFTTVLTNVQAQSAKEKVITGIAAFPYQHTSDATASLTAMGTWNKSEWKAFMKLLDDDSLKVKATYALSAYVNEASMDANKKTAAIILLEKYLSSSKTEYAKILIQSQLNLLADKSAIEQANNSLPKLP